MTDRIQLLRKLLFDGTHKQYRVEDPQTSILNESTAVLPFAIRKAMAFARACEIAPIFIQEGELIVGGKTLYKLPEYITQEEKEIGNEYFETGGGNCTDLFGFIYNLCQDERGFGTPNSSVPAYYKYLPMGISGMIALAEQKKAACEKGQEVFYESVLIALRAVITLMDRYRALAAEQESRCGDPVRRAELSDIVRVISNITVAPPADSYELIQLLYFIQFALWMEGGFLIPPGRLDQYLLPYYRADLESGRYTEERLCELLECMFIKLNYEVDRTHGGSIRFNSDTGQTVTIGGIDPETGEDASNELTLLMLDLKLDLRITDPRIHLRLSKKTPEEVWEKAAELTAAGMGFPTYDNDDAIIPALMNHDGYYSLSDARDYVGSGCWEIVVAGKSFNRNLGDIDCLRCLEWALHDGKNVLPIDEGAVGLIDGRWGLRTGDPRSFESFDDLMVAFKAQMKHNIDRVAINCNKRRIAPTPLYSAVMEDCMERGRDICAGGCRYNETDFQLSSLSNCADALYAIRKLVYEDKALTLGEFIAITDANYEGSEELRQELMNRLPKFGNDDDRVDALAAQIVAYYSREVKKHRNSFDGPYRARISSANGYVNIARALGASADGRKCSDFYSANLSAAMGAERSGPTGVVLSCGKLPTEGLSGGEMLDMKFNPNALSTEENRKKFIAVIKTYFNMGGLQAQVNVLDRDTLLDAKAHPEKYPDMLVRVWGFSAYFVALPAAYQDHIIARTAMDM